MLKLMTTHRLLQLLEKNDSAAELSDTNTTTNQVQLEFNPRQHQMSPSAKKTPLKLPPYIKEYLCFQTYGRTVRTDQCSKPIALTINIDTILPIE